MIPYIYMENYTENLCFMSESTILACGTPKGKFLFSFCMCHVETQTTNLWANFLVVLPMTVEIVMGKIPKQQKTAKLLLKK